MKRYWIEHKAYILLGLLAILCLFGIYRTGVLTPNNIDLLSHWMRKEGMVGMLLFILAYTIRPLFFIPMLPVTLFGGYTFGAITGTLLNIIGAGNSAVVAFYITRNIKSKRIRSFLENHRKQIISDQIEKHGFRVVLYIRLIPFIPFDSINYGMGLSKVKVRDYVVASYIGIIPGIFVANFVGNSLRNIWSIQFIVAILLYGFVILIPYIYNKWNKKND